MESGINKLTWRFSQRQFKTIASFETELRAANEQLESKDWDPQAPAANFDELLLQYMCNIGSLDDLLENEFLRGADQNTFDEYPDLELHQVEIFAKLTAENGTYFTVTELLFKAHNQLAGKKLGDHVFFEDVGPQPGKVNGLPVFYISAGS